MKVLLDTSVLVAAMVEQHRDHGRAFAVLDRVQNGSDEGVVSAHSLVETYAVLTRLPTPFRHSPEQALLSIEENVLKYFKPISLSEAEYPAFLRESAAAGIQGGSIYDAVHLKSAWKAGADRVYTFNLREFQAIAPRELASSLCTP